MNVNQQKQSTCIACRLAKCVAVGMSSEYMRKSSRTKRTNTTAHLRTNPAVSTFHTSSPMTDQTDLEPNEWRSISNIVHAYDTFSVISHYRGIIQASDHQAVTDALDPMKLTTQIFGSTQSFIRSIPDFQILTANEQESLFRRNLKSLICLNSTYIRRESGLSSNDQFNQMLIRLHGGEMVWCQARLERQLDQDPILVKLILVVATFSSNLFITEADDNFHQDALRLGIFRLFGSQNIYVQLLWKYLIYRYDFRGAVLRYSQLIKQILDTSLLVNQICQRSKNNEELRNIVAQRTRESFHSQQQVDPVPVWGYTTTTKATTNEYGQQ